MKKYLLTLLLSGCVSYPEYCGVDYPPTGRPAYDASSILQTLQITHNQAAELQQYANISSNNNNLSQALLNFQNANRNLNAILQNPWNGIYLLR